MTDSAKPLTPKEAEERVHEACPCKFSDSSWCQNNLKARCYCCKADMDKLPKYLRYAPCIWPGHQAARDLRRACAERASNDDDGLARGYYAVCDENKWDAYADGRNDAAAAIMED